MAQSLTAYLDLVKRTRPEEIVMISREIDPAYELTALVVKLEREGRRRPVVICERLKGSEFPVLTNLHASRSRLALAMSSAPQDMLRTYLRAMDRPIPPIVVKTGPCKDTISTSCRSSSITRAMRGPTSRPPSPSPRTRAASRGTAPTTGS